MGLYPHGRCVSACKKLDDRGSCCQFRGARRPKRGMQPRKGRRPEFRRIKNVNEWTRLSPNFVGRRAHLTSTCEIATDFPVRSLRGTRTSRARAYNRSGPANIRISVPRLSWRFLRISNRSTKARTLWWRVRSHQRKRSLEPNPRPRRDSSGNPAKPLSGSLRRRTRFRRSPAAAVGQTSRQDVKPKQWAAGCLRDSRGGCFRTRAARVAQAVSAPPSSRYEST